MLSAPYCANWKSHIVVIVMLFAALTVPTKRAGAQAPQGYNAVCLTSACAGAAIAPSSAFIDASAFSAPDFCQTVNEALYELSTATALGGSNGGVVDARGLNPGTTGVNTCANDPFAYPNPISTPSTVLLPSGVISILVPWVLPDRTRIIGEGNNPNNGTQIFVESGFSGSTMIQMGSAACPPGPGGSPQCYGLSVENVYFFGGGKTINGIVNEYGGTGSYVDHVNLYHVDGVGLIIGEYATDSGPYTNIAMTAGGVNPNNNAPLCIAATSCVHLGDSNFIGPMSTRGIHGLTCTCQTGLGTAAVGVNSSNNTLEDMHFEGYIDGVQVGYQGIAQNNVLLNVNGGGTGQDSMTNVIHICSSNSATTTCPSTNLVSDVTIQTANSTTSQGGTVANVITDDLTGAMIPSLTSPPTVTSVGMYVIGDAMGSNSAHTRFTNSSNLANWSTSSTSATVSSGCKSGSLLSNINGVSGGGGGTKTNYTIWVCKSGGWTPLKP